MIIISQYIPFAEIYPFLIRESSLFASKGSPSELVNSEFLINF